MSENQALTASDDLRGVNEQEFAFVAFSSVKDNVPRACQEPRHDFIARLLKHRESLTKDVACWSPVNYRPGARRGNAGVESITAIVLDFDHATPNWSQFTDYEYVAYTTFSHTDDDPHWRMVIFVVAPIPVSEWADTHARVMYWLASTADPACKDPARLYYVPTCQPGGPHDALHHRGRLLNPRELPPAPQTDDDVVLGTVNNGTDRPGDLFAATTTWTEILEGAGWTLVRSSGTKGFWRCPNSDKRNGEHCATTGYGDGDYLYTFCNAEGTPFEPRNAYSKFAAYAKLAHGGDFRAAARALNARRRGEQSGGQDSFRVVNNPTSENECKPRIVPSNGLYSVPPQGFPENANRNRPTGLVFRSASEIIDSAVEPDWAIEGFLARSSVTMISAREKVGKTTLTMSSIAAVQQGLPFLGRRTKKTGVIYLTEETGATLPEKLKRFGITDDGVVWLTRDMTGGLTNFRDIMALVVEEAKQRDAGVIVVDTFAYWAGFRGDDENSSGAMLGALRPALDAAAEGLAVLVIHHNSRQGGEYRGSTAIGGAVDVIISMTEDNTHSDRRILKARSRFGATPDRLTIELRGNTFVSLGDPGAATHADDETTIMAALTSFHAAANTASGAPPWPTRDDLQQITNVPMKKLAASLLALETTGHLVRCGDGRKGSPFTYSLPEVSEEASMTLAPTPSSSEPQDDRVLACIKRLTQGNGTPSRVLLEVVAKDSGLGIADTEASVAHLVARHHIVRDGGYCAPLY